MTSEIIMTILLYGILLYLALFIAKKLIKANKDLSAQKDRSVGRSMHVSRNRNEIVQISGSDSAVTNSSLEKPFSQRNRTGIRMDELLSILENETSTESNNVLLRINQEASLVSKQPNSKEPRNSIPRQLNRLYETGNSFV